MHIIVIKILTMLMPTIIFFNSFVVPMPFLSDKAEIEYLFANETAGSAAGTVTVTSGIGGKYELFWGTDDKEKLSMDVDNYTAYYSGFAEIKVFGGRGSKEIIEFTAIPEGAETVLAYKNKILMGSYEIPEEKQADFGEEIYRFGALSDLHFNRYNGSLTGDDATVTFPNALNFLEKFDVELVGMSGDISADGERDAFEKFNKISSEYDFPVYTCTGNHDVSKYFTFENWQELMNAGVYGEEKADGVADVAANGMDFVYAPADCNGDVFIFLSQYKWDYGTLESRILTDEQLDWLEAQLEKYSDKTVFLFFHTFLNNPVEGEEPAMGEGNLINNVGRKYDLAFTEGCADEVRFEALMKEHKNVVFFNGHSHWRYDMQKLNPQLNIANYGGEYATMVHISSVSSPRTTKINLNDGDEHYMRNSEGMLVTVYNDCIVFTGVEFLKGELLSYATYVVEK
ncbi:MAG: metallophosphoesterase [Clostridia bacterium]|nr:metallophosphoesterase [Clostridia bacterium]